jgi:hypothetical protein
MHVLPPLPLLLRLQQPRRMLLRPQQSPPLPQRRWHPLPVLAIQWAQRWLPALPQSAVQGP